MHHRIRSMAVALLAAALCCAADAAGENTDAIDDALLMTKFTVLGVKLGVERQVGAALPQAQAECLDAELAPLARRHYRDSMRAALSPAQIEQGARLASAPVFADVNRYILAHQQSLREEGKNVEGDFAHYLLATAAVRTAQPPQAQEQIRAFVAWHEQAHRQISPRVAQRTPGFIRSVAEILVRCGKAA